MRSRFRGMFQLHVVIAAALILVALVALALVLVPGISSLRAREACARATIWACLRTPVPASKDAKLLLALPQTVLRPSLGGSPKPVSVEPYHGDAHWVMRTGLHTEQKHRAGAVPLPPDVLKPERWHSRPARPLPHMGHRPLKRKPRQQSKQGLVKTALRRASLRVTRGARSSQSRANSPLPSPAVATRRCKSCPCPGTGDSNHYRRVDAPGCRYGHRAREPGGSVLRRHTLGRYPK